MMNSTVNTKRVHFLGINFLRFLSAFALILYHCTLGLQKGVDTFWKMALHNLYIGVDLFFIISGFLITYLLIVEKQETGKISFKKFYIRRSLRILPLYYLIILLAYYLFHNTHPETDFVSHLFFFGNFSLITNNSWTITPLNPLWSICIEEHFYLVVPLLVSLVPTKKLHYMFISIIMLSIGFRAYTFYFDNGHWMTLYMHTLSRCDVIAIGGILAHQLYFGKQIVRCKRIWLFVAIVMLLVIMSSIDYGDYTTLFNATLKKYIFVIPMAIIFAAFILSKSESDGFSKIKNNKVFDYFGKISYGLYMYHSIVILYVVKISFLKDSDSLIIIAVTILTLLISALSYELFEMKFLKLKKSFVVIKTDSSLEVIK